MFGDVRGHLLDVGADVRVVATELQEDGVGQGGALGPTQEGIVLDDAALDPMFRDSVFDSRGFNVLGGKGCHSTHYAIEGEGQERVEVVIPDHDAPVEYNINKVTDSDTYKLNDKYEVG